MTIVPSGGGGGGIRWWWWCGAAAWWTGTAGGAPSAEAAPAGSAAREVAAAAATAIAPKRAELRMAVSFLTSEPLRARSGQSVAVEIGLAGHFLARTYPRTCAQIISVGPTGGIPAGTWHMARTSAH